MKRAVIIGPGASGKSTLASHLGEITGLRVIELDKLFWQQGLVETPLDQWIELQQRLVRESEWIMDGDLGPYDAIEVRLQSADTIINLLIATRSHDLVPGHRHRLHLRLRLIFGPDLSIHKDPIGVMCLCKAAGTQQNRCNDNLPTFSSRSPPPGGNFLGLAGLRCVGPG